MTSAYHVWVANRGNVTLSMLDSFSRMMDEWAKRSNIWRVEFML